MGQKIRIPRVLRFAKDPHVAGVAALVMSQFPSLSVNDVVNRILATGSRLDGLAGLVKSGALVDAYAALAGVAPITLSASSIAGRVTLSWNVQSGAIFLEELLTALHAFYFGADFGELFLDFHGVFDGGRTFEDF